MHISNTGYLEDGAPRFAGDDRVGFDHARVVEVEDGDEDGEEAVTDSEEEANKMRR